MILRPNYILFLNNSVEHRFKIISHLLNYESLIMDMPIPEKQFENYIIRFTISKNIEFFFQLSKISIILMNIYFEKKIISKYRYF